MDYSWQRHQTISSKKANIMTNRFFQQLKVLLWKNYKLKTRRPVSKCFSWNLLIVLIRFLCFLADNWLHSLGGKIENMSQFWEFGYWDITKMSVKNLYFQVLFVIEIFIPIVLCFILGQVRRTKPPTVMTSSELYCEKVYLT